MIEAAAAAPHGGVRQGSKGGEAMKFGPLRVRVAIAAFSLLPYLAPVVKT